MFYVWYMIWFMRVFTLDVPVAPQILRHKL
jgi:hypothetical protein